MKEWQSKEIDRLEKEVKEEIYGHATYISNVINQLSLAKKLIEKTSVPIRIGLEPILHQLRIHDANNSLVHQLVRDWRVIFKKRFSTMWGHFVYSTDIDGIPVIISKVKDVPRCKIIPKKETQEVTVYESICGPEVK